jgi:quinol monooxygenase YgiN
VAEKFTCGACGGTFESKAELDAHTKKEHMQPSEPAAPGKQKPM